MSKLKKFLKFLLLSFSIGTCTLGLVSCSSVEKKSTSYDFEVVSCEYVAEEDITKVVWSSRIVNETIYDIENVTFRFDVYNVDSYVRTTDDCVYSIAIKHGKSNNGNRGVSLYGQVTNISIHSWTAKYSSLWKTYQPWFIATIISAAVLALIYIIFMIVSDLELFDLGEFLEDHLWTLGMFLIPFIPYVIEAAINSNWSFVPPIIIGGGIVALVVVALLGHLIKFIVEEVSLNNFSLAKEVKPEKHYDSKNRPYFYSSQEKKKYYIKDLVDDYDSLNLFSKQDLLEFCENKSWFDANGKKDKERLINLIMDNESVDSSDDVEEAEATSKKSVKKKKYSKTTFNDIAGLDEAKKAFNEKVVMPFIHPEIFEKFGKKAGGGILLYGLPGTGKTMFAEAAANEVDALFIPIKCSDVKSKWYGESEQKVKEIFKKAKKAEKAIIFFDEFEAIGAKRTDSENGNNDLVPQILAEMQGIGSSSNKTTIVVIAATNKPWAIDSAFMRPGRFDEKIYIPLPDFEARKKLFQLQLSKLPISNDLDFDYLAKITDGFNGADIKEVCEKLKMSAINDSLQKGEEQTIGMDDVKRIENNIKSSVSLEDIDNLKEFERTF